jgi:hypothetical protein
MDQLVGLAGDGVVGAQESLDGLAFEHAKPVEPGRHSLTAHRRWSLDDECNPPSLGERHVLNEAGQGELADGCASCGLFVAQPAQRVPQQESVSV